MKKLHLFIPATIYLYKNTFYVPNNYWFNEMAKHFSIEFYANIKTLETLDEKSKTPLDTSIKCHHFFDSTSTLHFLKKWREYKQKLLKLPQNDYYMVYYPFQEISIFLATLLRNRKLAIWVRSDTSQVMLSKQMLFSDGWLKGIYRLLLNPFKVLVYTLASKYLLHKALVFYTANTLFNHRNHRNQHEIISCSNLNDDSSLIKKEITHNIAFVGSEHPRKGLTILLRALQKIKNERTIVLNIIGCSELKNPTNQKLTRGLTIKYHGPIYERTAFYNLLAQNDILVMPSFAEKQGKVQLEAMSAGVVAICSDSGGTYQTINNYYNGLLFKPGDSQELANLIDLLYQNLELYKQLKQNGLDYTAALSLEKQTEKMATIMNNYFTFTR